MRSHCMNMQSSKVIFKLFLLLWTDIFEILVVKHDNASLGDQQTKLIFLRIGQLRELETRYPGADTRSELDGL